MAGLEAKQCVTDEWQTWWSGQMVERSGRGKGKRPLLGNHQRCWIWGRRVVSETLLAGRWIPWELRLSDGLPEDEITASRQLAVQQNVPVLVETAAQLTRLCRSSEHQGYLAKMPPFPYDDAEKLLATLPAQPFCAILDAVQDPYNFGAILRSADALGVDAVFVGSGQQSPVTSLVARTSAGAVNHVHLAEARDLSHLCGRLIARGLSLVAATEKAKLTISQCDFRGAVACVIGNEGAGIRRELLALCEQHAAIPQVGHVSSLNAAVSASILFYEVQRQRSGSQTSKGNE